MTQMTSAAGYCSRRWQKSPRLANCLDLCLSLSDVYTCPIFVTVWCVSLSLYYCNSVRIHSLQSASAGFLEFPSGLGRDWLGFLRF